MGTSNCLYLRHLRRRMSILIFALSSMFAFSALFVFIVFEQLCSDHVVVSGNATLILLGTGYSLLELRVKKVAEISTVEHNVVFCGGFNESELAKDIFDRFGGKAKAVWLENESKTTFENVKFARLLMEREKVDSRELVVISDSFHSVRSLALFRAFFPKSDVRFVKSDRETLLAKHLKWCFREVLGIAKGMYLGHFGLFDLVGAARMLADRKK